MAPKMLPKFIKNLTFGVRGSDFCDFGKVLGGFKKTDFLSVEEISLSSAQGGAGGVVPRPGSHASGFGGVPFSTFSTTA